MSENLNDKIYPESKQVKWSQFVESTALHFFDEHKIEKFSIEDGNGNKAKLSRTKDNEIKIEYSTVVML